MSGVSDGSIQHLDLIGAITAYVIFISSIAVFASRLLFDDPPDRWLGVPLLLAAFPLAYLLFKAPSAGRPFLYYLQVGLMLLWILVELIVDYVLRYPFRDELPLVIGYVTLYFAGMGGMIGVASQAGTSWTVGAVLLFFLAGILAFVQRSVTGL
jgi:hypothetical protein